MKNCTITFKIGDTIHNIVVPENELYGAEGERSLPTEEFQKRLATVLNKNKKQWGDIKRDIVQYLKDNSAISQAVSYSKISKQDGLVPNVSYKYIQDTYPEIDFPSIDVPILLLDNLDMQSKFPVSGRVLDKKGKEIFVVRGDKDSLVQLAGYLKIREKVLSGEYKQSLDKELSDMLSRIAEKKGLSPEETILQYLNNTKQEKKKEKGILEGASIYTWMTYIGAAIKGTPSKRRYKNPILNEFNKRLTSNKEGLKILTISELHSILLQSFPHIFTTLKLLKEIFNKKAGDIVEYIATIKNLNDTEKDFLGRFMEAREVYRNRHTEDETDQWGIATLFHVINSYAESNENALSLRPITLTKDKLILEDRFPTLESAYGFSYETVASFTKEEERNGYYIYSQTKEVGNKTITYYYVTPYFINEKLNAQRFASIADAQDWIDEHYITKNLRTEALVDLKLKYIDGGLKERLGRTFLSEKFIQEGTIFKTLDIPIDIRSSNMKEEEYDLLSKSLQDFYNYIETTEFDNATKALIQSKIDTAEKAVIFLSEINRQMNSSDETGNKLYLRVNNDKAKAIVNEIDKKKPSYYYVSTSYKVDDGKYRIRYTMTDESAVTEKRYNKRTPVIQLLNSIAREMRERFGVPVKVIGPEELTEMGIEDLNLVKAFIRNGEIYINRAIAKSSDAFHEYAHLFLGAMKANPELRDSYVELIEKVLSTKEGQKALNRKIKNFPEASRVDLEEEVVADLYGHFMEDNLPYELNTLFAANDKIKSMVDTIFDKKDKSKSIREFDGSLDGLWKKFNSNVAKYLDDNINFIKDAALQVQRRKDNWLKKQIKDGKIKEDCE